MSEIYHIDLSNRFWQKKTTGISCVGAGSKKHNGCALSIRVKRYILMRLFIESESKEYAKLYAICIYYLIKDKLDTIEKLVICNDEQFIYVRKYLTFLLLRHGPFKFQIINISQLRKILNKDIKSPANNYSRAYAKRGLKKNKWNRGIKLNVVEITYSMIAEKWVELKNVSG